MHCMYLRTWDLFTNALLSGWPFQDIDLIISSFSAMISWRSCIRACLRASADWCIFVMIFSLLSLLCSQSVRLARAKCNLRCVTYGAERGDWAILAIPCNAEVYPKQLFEFHHFILTWDVRGSGSDHWAVHRLIWSTIWKYIEPSKRIFHFIYTIN